MTLTVGSLFSGIGGIDLGLERAGMRVKWQCEIDSYCRAVLRHHWPDVYVYPDIHDIQWSAPRVDVVAGGFPCQPVSLAGKGLAQKDPRWLWPEFARVVGLLRPRYVIVENVPGLVRRGLSDVVGDLAEMGYDAEWQIVSAASVGAPHLRERLIVVAYPNSHGERFEERQERDSEPIGGAARQASLRDDSCGLHHVVPDSECEQLRIKPGWSGGESGADTALAPVNGEARSLADTTRQLLDWGRTRSAGRSESSDRSWWISEPAVGRVADGVPNRVAQLRALGNAVVPQVAEFVGRLILEAEQS